MFYDDFLRYTDEITTKGTIGSATVAASSQFVQSYGQWTGLADYLTHNVVAISAGCTLALFILKLIVTILEEIRKEKIFRLVIAERRQKQLFKDNGSRRRDSDKNPSLQRDYDELKKEVNQCVDIDESDLDEISRRD